MPDASRSTLSSSYRNRIITGDAVAIMQELPANSIDLVVPAAAGGQVEAEQGAFGAVAVLDARGAHHHGDRQAGSVGDDEPFAAVDLLPVIPAPG